MGRARACPWADITGRAGPALNYFRSCCAWAVLFSVLRAGPPGPAQMYTYTLITLQFVHGKDAKQHVVHLKHITTYFPAPTSVVRACCFALSKKSQLIMPALITHIVLHTISVRAFSWATVTARAARRNGCTHAWKVQSNRPAGAVSSRSRSTARKNPCSVMPQFRR
jgi:hypothetical protein